MSETPLTLPTSDNLQQDMGELNSLHQAGNLVEKGLEGLKLEDRDTLEKIAGRVYELFLLEARIERDRTGRR